LIITDLRLRLEKLEQEKIKRLKETKKTEKVKEEKLEKEKEKKDKEKEKSKEKKDKEKKDKENKEKEKVKEKAPKDKKKEGMTEKEKMEKEPKDSVAYNGRAMVTFSSDVPKADTNRKYQPQVLKFLIHVVLISPIFSDERQCSFLYIIVHGIRTNAVSEGGHSVY
jgi:hypothetical protein